MFIAAIAGIFPGVMLAQGGEIPIVSSKIQLLMLGLSGILLVAVIGVIKLLWSVRSPAFSLMQSYLQSDGGKQTVAGVFRDYLTTAEGRVFMEGVINGKLRGEIAVHNASREAHYELQGQFATLKELNAGLQTVRDRQEPLTDKVCKMLEEKFDDLSRDLWETFKK